MKRFICLILVALALFTFASAENFDDLPLITSDSRESCEITKLTFDGRFLKVFFNFTNLTSERHNSNLIIYAEQEDIDCESDYYNSDHDFADGGATITCKSAFQLNNSHDIVHITARIMMSDELLTFYFDPITERTSLEYLELLRYRENNMPRMLFATKRHIGEVISYGKWAYTETLMNNTTEFEFFSNGSYTMNDRPVYNDGVTHPGIYTVKGNMIETYYVSDGGSFYQQTFEVSEDGRTITLVDSGYTYTYVE